MKHRNSIVVFEHQYLKVGEQGFGVHHFNKLVDYNELHNHRYFQVGNKRIKTGSFVGIIQVADLTIEILPKADYSSDENKWRMALLTMLSYCRKIRVKSLSDAFVRIKTSTLLDFIIESFLNEVESLIIIGLTKGYRFTTSNKSIFKGKLLFSEHIKENHSHRERFFTRHETYDFDILLNRIIKTALLILLRVSIPSRLKIRVNKILLNFETVSNAVITEKDLDNIHFSRKSDMYRDAIKIAKLIIQSYNPDIKQGNENILALLFDMNNLYEEYIYQILKIEAGKYADLNLKVSAQKRKRFWESRSIKPDLLIEYEDPTPKKIIIDTKWKLLKDPYPSDPDLKQMFAYNLYFEASRSILLYPKLDQNYNTPKKFYAVKDVTRDHACQIAFADLFDEKGRRRQSAAEEILSIACTDI